MSDESSEIAAHILEECSNLCEMAMRADLDVLAHLLSMAMLQASRDLSNDGADSGSHS
jgi:hypothetical protein